MAFNLGHQVIAPLLTTLITISNLQQYTNHMLNGNFVNWKVFDLSPAKFNAFLWRALPLVYDLYMESSRAGLCLSCKYLRYTVLNVLVRVNLMLIFGFLFNEHFEPLNIEISADALTGLAIFVFRLHSLSLLIQKQT